MEARLERRMVGLALLLVLLAGCTTATSASSTSSDTTTSAAPVPSIDATQEEPVEPSSSSPPSPSESAELDRRAANRLLLAAAESGDVDAAALAIRSGARLETRDKHRRTPLLLASTYDRVDVARLLVSLGADPDALDDRHDTPWLVTGVTGSVAMLEALLPANPDLTMRNRFGGISVIPASERGHVGYVRRVVQTDIDVNHVNDLGWTALLEAVILGDGSKPYQEIVRILLDAGADPSIPDGEGITALQHARSRGHDKIARMLAAAASEEGRPS